MGMKRWVSALLALLLLCAMGFVASAEPEELEAPVEEQEVMLGESEPTDDEVVFDGLLSEAIESETIDAELAQDPETCSHTNTHTWSGTFNDWEDADPREKYTYTSVNNAEHKIKGYRYTVTYCEDCDTDINVVRDKKSSTWTEGHDYDENGKCRLCGHVNTCSHPNMEHNDGPRNWEDGEEYEVVSLNNREHQITGHRYHWDWCPDCERELNITRDDAVTTWTQNHWYNDRGICDFDLCRYVNNCKHPRVEHNAGAYRWWDGEKYSVKSVNEQEHKITGAWYTWDYCPDCDRDVNIIRGAKKTWKEHHHYGDDLICHFELCGHKNACKHKHVEHNEGVYYWQDDAEPHEDYKVVSLNDAEHQITGHKYTWNWCQDCDCDINIKRDPNVTTWTAGHWYDDGDVCHFDLCGHVNTCKHANLEHCEGAYNWWDGEKYTVKSANEREHKITGAYYTWDHCPDCDRNINVKKGAKKTWAENHHYGDDLVCHFDLCQHRNKCKHKNLEHNEGVYHWEDDAEPHEDYKVVSLDNAEHQITGHKYTWDWCRDCECDINVKRDSAVTTWKQGHWYNDKGVCDFDLCGHANTCKHQNLERREGSRPWEGGYKSIKAADYMEHKVKGPYYTWDWCPDCYQDLNIVNHGVQTFTEGHDYDWDLKVPQCRWCGKKLDCTHKKAEADGGVLLLERDIDDYEIKFLNEHEHEVTGDYFTWKWCPDCGQFINVKLEGNKTFNGGHWFNSEGFCNLCGYKCENVYELKANKSTEMKKGDILFVSLGNNTAVSFKSSKPAVVDTDGPILFAKEAGTANITVKLTNKKTLKLVVTVVDPFTPKKLTIKEPTSKTIDMNVTPSLALEYSITPNTASDAKVTWESKNPKLATVDEKGMVTFLDKGSVTITATTIGEKGKKITAKIKLTIKK